MRKRPKAHEFTPGQGQRKSGRRRKLLAWQVSYVLRAMRLRAGLTNKALAEKMGVSCGTITSIRERALQSDRYGRDTLPSDVAHPFWKQRKRTPRKLDRPSVQP